MISRPTLIGALVVVELAIVGAAFRAIGLGAGPAAPPHRPAWSWDTAAVAKAASTGGLDRTFSTGPAPHVVLDIRNVPVRIEAAGGPSVRVVDSVQRRGWVSGTIAPVRAERTADGVRISIPDGTDVIAFGSFDRRLRVSVPPGATVEVATGARVDAAGLRSRLTVRSSDGSIHVRDHRGELDLQTSDGRVELSDVQGPTVLAQTRDGSLTLTRVAADRLEVRTGDGRVTADAVRLIDGVIASGDGRVRIGYTPDSAATVNVHTGDGRITLAGGVSADDTGGDRHNRTVRIGSGRGQFEVSSGDGSISITPGAQV
jgi:hypothetical protein